MTRSVANSDSLVWPHRWATLLACATFPLIWVGGLVTTTDAGMAVPDWPNTYGYNLLFYPWQTWFFGPWDLFVEHGHRLLGALVGLLTIATTASVFVAAAPRWLKVWSLVALVAVVGQGVLGGLRVLWDERLLALVHGCTGPMFFCFVVGMAVVTSRSWQSDRWARARRAAPHIVRRFERTALVTAVLALLQLGLGATLRHMPAAAAPSSFRGAVVFHLVMAAVIAIHAAVLVWLAWRQPSQLRLPRSIALTLFVAVLLQIVLGAATWVMKYSLPSVVGEFTWAATLTIQAGSWLQTHTVTLHVALGSLILAFSVVASLFALAGRGPWAARSAAWLPSVSTMAGAAREGIA